MENTASLDASNLGFTIGRITLPMGVGGRSVVIRRPGTSLAVPVLDDDQVVELHQYRIAVATRLLGIAGSELDPDERRLSAMQRELQEEAGYSPSQWDPLGAMLPCPGYSDQVIHLILARELQALVVRPSSDDEEDLAVLLKETTELEAGPSSGDEYLDSKSVSAWYGPRQLNRIEYCAKTLNHRSSVLT